MSVEPGWVWLQREAGEEPQTDEEAALELLWRELGAAEVDPVLPLRATSHSSDRSSAKVRLRGWTTAAVGYRPVSDFCARGSPWSLSR